MSSFSFLLTSLLSSLIYLLLELYTIARLISFTAPPELQPRYQLSRFTDVRIVRAGSLLLLELLTVVPDAIHINILGDFVPFSVGGVIVLGQF